MQDALDLMALEDQQKELQNQITRLEAHQAEVRNFWSTRGVLSWGGSVQEVPCMRRYLGTGEALAVLNTGCSRATLTTINNTQSLGNIVKHVLGCLWLPLALLQVSDPAGAGAAPSHWCTLTPLLTAQHVTCCRMHTVCVLQIGDVRELEGQLSGATKEMTELVRQQDILRGSRQTQNEVRQRASAQLRVS
jgi:hypothetical protein